MNQPQRLFPIVIGGLIMIAGLSACHHHDKELSFYYWRTAFAPDSLEKTTLTSNGVKTLYLRYFDVDLPPGDTMAVPVAPIVFRDVTNDREVVPVVYFRNRVFEKGDSITTATLVEKIFLLISQINKTQHIGIREVQFDCDWTEKTRDHYFFFLRQYRALSGQPVTCTIRLHQVKYPGRTGIPPVDRGVLMYYNMGDIDAGEANSIYEPSVAARYIPSLRDYPMTLDIALPIFSWGLQIREGHVIRLLNKMNFLHFQNDPNFERSDSNRYRAKIACFSGGYYFKEGDLVKIEHVSAGELAQIAEEISRHSNHRLGNIIFYDLDKTNLILYEKNVFKEVLDHFN